MNSNTLQVIRRFIVNDDGPTAVEYAVMLMLIAMGAIASIQIMGSLLAGSLNNSVDKIKAASGS